MQNACGMRDAVKLITCPLVSRLEDHPSATELRELGESARRRRDLNTALRHYEEASNLLAISAAVLVGRGDHCRPNRSRGSLGNGLPLERWLTFCRELLIYLVDHGLEVAVVHVAA